MLCKQRLEFKQCIPNKRFRFGITFFYLCEFSGYLLNCVVYSGNQKNVPLDEATLIKEILSVVLFLLSSCWSHTTKENAYMVIWCTSEKLFICHQVKGTVSSGTVKRKRLYLPKTCKEVKLRQGGHSFRKDDNKLMTQYQDKKEVYSLSTIYRKNQQLQKKEKEITPIYLSLCQLTTPTNTYIGQTVRHATPKTVRKTQKCVQIHILSYTTHDNEIFFQYIKLSHVHFSCIS